jgi:hypothetical protein
MNNTPSENVFLKSVSENGRLYDITSNILDHYIGERRKLLQKISLIKENCKADWKLFIKTDINIHSLTIDLLILEDKIKELKFKLRKVEKSRRLICELSLIGTFHLKKISNKKKTQIEKETCVICFNPHKISRMLTTKCGHHFGECCFGKYLDNKVEKYQEISCPLCRNNNILPVVKYY